MLLDQTLIDSALLPTHRLDKALAQVRASTQAVTFTPHLLPYQLNPELPDSIDKQQWYLKEKFLDDADALAKFQSHIASLLNSETDGEKKLRFDGEIGNTFRAHRVLQYFQEKDEENGGQVAGRILDGLYRRYFCEARHPTEEATLIESCVEAGIPEAKAREVVQDEGKGQQETKLKIREVARDVDAVPVVVVEGKRRDVTLTGAKEVKDYIKAFETVIKESS